MADEKQKPAGISSDTKPSMWNRDRPGCIKYILLVLLVLLLFAEIISGEFRGFPDIERTTWFVLLIKLFLIALLVALIRVQRSLFCKLDEPTGCTLEEPDPVAGKLIVRVKGSAWGGAFGWYTVDIRKVGFPSPIAGVVVYPGGGASGTSPVVGAELAQIDTTGLDDDAYEVTLTVYPAWGGSTKVCQITFNLLKSIVYMSRFAGVQAISDTPSPGNPNPFDPDAELRNAANETVAVGGKMAIKGAAYVYECATRKIKKYDVRHALVAAPGPLPAQPATGDPIPPTFSGNIAQLDYASADHYQPWTRVGPAPQDLVNSWKTFTIGGSTYFKLKQGHWNSWPVASGRYSVLLTAEDTTGVTFHDIQHIWLDNHNVKADIVEFQWKNPDTNAWEKIPPCTPLSLNVHGQIRILGLAWDPLIDEAWWTLPGPPERPNDNFGHYSMHYKKQFQTWKDLVLNVTNRVPALPAAAPVPVPTPADADVLHTWDLTTLDAGPSPGPGAIAPDSKLYRGESCTFSLRLFVTDPTVVPDGPGDHHQKWKNEPIEIVNDL